MKNYLIHCFIICISFSFAQEHLNFTKSLDSILSIELKENNVPGMAIAIIEDRQLIYKKGIGFANIDAQTKMTTSTGFNIGSISKMFTAWGIMKLVEKEQIHLDVPVENYLTRWKLPESNFDNNKVTVRALLSHTAGLSVHGYPGFPTNDKLPTLEASLNGDNGPVRVDEKVEIVIEPQTKFDYSGGGYTILQLLIEEVTGESFEIYMRNEIFKPLKMKYTSFTIDKKILENSAKPYDENGKEVGMEYFTAKAAAGLQTNLEDLIIFAEATLNGNVVLKTSTIEEMMVLIPITRFKRGAQGLGYQAYLLGPITAIGHAGSNTGWEAGFMMDIESNSAIIMLTNGSKGKNVAKAMLRRWAKWKIGNLKSKD